MAPEKYKLQNAHKKENTKILSMYIVLAKNNV
jgi:hypothetical protein